MAKGLGKDMVTESLSCLHAFQYGIADEFGYLRDYGVSERGNSVAEMGNPIISSTKDGCG